MINADSYQWNDAEREAGTLVLRKIAACHEAGLGIPGPVYEAHLGSKVNVSTELAAFDHNGRLYMLQRPTAFERPEEPYPSQMHLPGVTRVLDETLEQSIERLRLSEGIEFDEDGLLPVDTVELIGITGSRGNYVARLYIALDAKLSSDSKGLFYSRSELPGLNLIVSHEKELVPKALQVYDDLQ